MKETSHNRAITNSLKQLEVICFSTFEYGKCKLPLTTDMLKNSVFVNFFHRDKILLDNAFYFVKRSGLNCSTTQLNELDEQFLKYQLLKEIDIPASVSEDAEVKHGDNLKNYRMHVIWGHIVKRKTIFGNLEFDLLSKIAKLVLLLPHSKAGKERVFIIY